MNRLTITPDRLERLRRICHGKRIPWAMVRELIEESHRLVAPARRARTTKKQPRRR